MSYLLEQIKVKKLIGLSEQEELNKIKSFVSKIYEDAGYSNSPWKNIDHYDLWSIWFYVEENGQILSAMRITEKKPFNFIPLEVALFKDEQFPPKRYAVLEENVADWNSVAFIQNVKGAKAAKANFIAVAEHCITKEYNTVYGMYNPKLSGIERIYLREGAEISVKYPGPMYFPGLYLKGEIPWFEVIEIRKESLQKIASKKE
ncbi:hypothetical protein L9Z41_03385 [Leptospira noguchii]|uniref:LBL_2463 family protein n=1 Tax=Leptospira noguchii TaxID=28182 RepID=UPI001F05B9A2|nr:hypothetical protein [Leptospira noguchii]MCH1911635.1 hypothetical protein [Leptospira noguchii]MCH1914718.1 hypothetical protein [Leptospira noguchii]UOG64648.1 hypothetical protein MAL04_03490 [Leptospira noguchii]